jgi:hypothetical protein
VSNFLQVRGGMGPGVVVGMVGSIDMAATILHSVFYFLYSSLSILSPLFSLFCLLSSSSLPLSSPFCRYSRPVWVYTSQHKAATVGVAAGAAVAVVAVVAVAAVVAVVAVRSGWQWRRSRSPPTCTCTWPCTAPHSCSSTWTASFPCGDPRTEQWWAGVCTARSHACWCRHSRSALHAAHPTPRSTPHTPHAIPHIPSFPYLVSQELGLV